jgi:Ca2+-binding RTX toxin-like protein
LNVSALLGGTEADHLYGDFASRSRSSTNVDEGEDSIFGNEGDDTIYGDSTGVNYGYGSGDDTIEGGSGNDVVYGDGGDAALVMHMRAEIFTFRAQFFKIPQFFCT